MFNPGDKVRTNDKYFKRTGRKVKGEVIKLYCEVPEHNVGVVWKEQEGEVDIRMQGLKVLMDSRELELDI